MVGHIFWDKEETYHKGIPSGHYQILLLVKVWGKSCRVYTPQANSLDNKLGSVCMDTCCVPYRREKII
jgi:hypothetical protein